MSLSRTEANSLRARHKQIYLALDACPKVDHDDHEPHSGAPNDGFLVKYAIPWFELSQMSCSGTYKSKVFAGQAQTRLPLDARRSLSARSDLCVSGFVGNSA